MNENITSYSALSGDSILKQFRDHTLHKFFFKYKNTEKTSEKLQDTQSVTVF